LKTPIYAPNIGVFGGFHPQNGEQCLLTKPPKGTSAGRNGSSGVLIVSLSVIVPEKSRGNKKCDKEEEQRHIFGLFWHRCKMAVTWFYGTLLIPICSFCRGQPDDANI